MVEEQERPDERRRTIVPRDFWFVATEPCTWVVSREMAMHVERELDARRPREWIVFVDAVGSRVRVRASLVVYVEQVSAEQRAEARRHRRAQQAEEHEWE